MTGSSSGGSGYVFYARLRAVNKREGIIKRERLGEICPPLRTRHQASLRGYLTAIIIAVEMR